ncbi:ABC transporter ATPase [Clostridium botulinum]|uniref:ABC transporter ATPase n=1 Tax=Clostridium botulinum TaxID=1491 RepID=UPI001C9ACF8E|nr:ABC transporter ATPase [Clostridium botulinum]MBY6844650.1 ABC transporter ATPase [Clostridium botulinum]
MKKLNTIQKREKLNDAYVLDEKGNGGANHRYVICKHGETSWCNGNNSDGIYADIQFQNGARKEEKSIHGIANEDLLEIVRHRLQCFQAGPFASEYNENALKHIEEALHCMNARVEDRVKRNVLGRNEK